MTRKKERMTMERPKPDGAITASAAKGGVIGIEAAPHTTLTERHPRHGIEFFMDHVPEQVWC